MQQHTSPAIHISDLSISYQHQNLFENFNLTFPAKKWSALLGPSGVGKTTILRFIANLIPPNATQISGKILVSDQQPITQRISYLAQQDLLMPWLNVLDNTLLGYRLRGEKNFAAQKTLAMTLLKKVGLGKTLHLFPEKLSGGMRQRVALVRTLLEDRPIILMDEPFSALDAITRIKLQALAAKLLANRTVILVTHDPLEALRLCDQIYIIKGEPAKLFTVPKPTGAAPRDPTQPSLLKKYAHLLKLLAGEN